MRYGLNGRMDRPTDSGQLSNRFSVLPFGHRTLKIRGNELPATNSERKTFILVEDELVKYQSLYFKLRKAKKDGIIKYELQVLNYAKISIKATEAQSCF